jgi:hypothetical protein
MNSTLPSRLAALGLLAAALAAALPAYADGVAPRLADPSQLAGSKGGDSARPAVGVPLVEAEALIKQGRFADALVRVKDAEAVADLTPYERYSTSRTKSAAAMSLGQTATAFDATEAAIGSGYLIGEPQRELMVSLIHAAYAAKDYARTVRWADRYLKEGGTRGDIEALRMQSQYLGGDYAGAAATLLARMKADDAAGRMTPERDLQLLLSAQRKSKDEAGSVQTVERLATRYPKPVYWGELINGLDRKNLSERLFIDLFRFMRATSNLTGAQENLWYAEVSLQGGLAGEALSVLDDAKAKGIFKDADLKKADALRAKAVKPAADDVANRKKDEASARTAKDGNALVFLGQSAMGEGRMADAAAMLEQGFAKGGLRRVDEQRLRLGEAQVLSGNRDAAKQTLSTLKGAEGMTELAHLWWLLADAAPAH